MGDPTSEYTRFDSAAAEPGQLLIFPSQKPADHLDSARRAGMMTSVQLAPLAAQCPTDGELRSRGRVPR